ncbi:MAG: AAA family ATPase [Patescibacteria group bacterium]
MKEKTSKFEEVVDKVERAQEKAPQKESTVSFGEKWASPGEGAEQLYALWRDYGRKRMELVGEYREKRAEPKDEKESLADRARRIQATVAVDTKLAPLRTAIRSRFQDSGVRAMFERTLERELTEQEKLAPSYENYVHERELKDEAEMRRLELYSDIFSHREKEPDELTLLEITDLGTRTKVAERRMRKMESENPELSAKLSFERLKNYREQLKRDGFIWTPSREKLFNKIMEHLVIVNQNRPLLLYGETGTGKTRLARAASQRLTGNPPHEVGEEAKTDIRPLLGLRSIDKDKETFVTYGPLGQALSGKKSSRDKEAGSGGIFYMDEMNGYPPDGLRSLIKQLSGRRAGEEISFAAWTGSSEKLAPQFGFVGSANLPSEKHPDRVELPVEGARELGSLEVDYPPQSPKNPELYEMMLAALMDQNDRIRVPKEELPPEWQEVVDVQTNAKRFEIDTEPKAGGTLWRFAEFVAAIQKSYKGEENTLTATLRDASYLRHAVLDPGLVLSWLQEYRKSAMRSHESLKDFLGTKITEWGAQKIYPEEDRNLVKKFQEKFQLG